MDGTQSAHQARLALRRKERAELVIRLTHACSYLTRSAFEQLIDSMMVVRAGDHARLALDGAS
jgi:hypothetical protein